LNFSIFPDSMIYRNIIFFEIVLYIMSTLRCYKCRKLLDPLHRRHGLHVECFQDWFSLENENEDFKDLYLRRDNSTNASQPHSSPNASFFHGKFKKYSARLGKDQYILKLSDEYPELAKTEFLCNQIASSLELVIPPYFLISFSEEVDCFVSYNFMHGNTPSDLKHIWHYLREEDSYSVKTLVRVIQTHTGRLKEIRKFIFLTLFDALIGNNDRHGRNLAFVVTSKGHSLSPTYDNPSYLGIEDECLLGAEHSPRGAISTENTMDPLMEDYVEEFIQLGYRIEVETFFQSINLEKIKVLVEGSFISEKRKKAIMRLIQQRYEALKHGL
jgi:hypothetical protein